MSELRMILNNISIDKNKLFLNIAFICPYDESVISPKVRAVFSRDDEVRRLPVPVSSYIRRSGSGDAVIICSYTYLLKYLFSSEESESETILSFEIDYGSLHCEKMCYCVSKGFTSAKSKGEIKPEYIADDYFSGTVSYGKDDTSSDDDADEINNAFDYSISPETGTVIITPLQTGERQSKIYAAFCVFTRLVFFVINIILCILLLPYFVADGILAATGLLPKRKYRPVSGFIPSAVGQIKTNISFFLKSVFKSGKFSLYLIKPADTFIRMYYKALLKKPVVKNRITIMSGRRDEIGGNEEFVYNLIKERKDIDFRFLMFSDVNGHKSFRIKKQFAYLYATSAVVIVDDYFTLLNSFKKRDDVTLFQLWHACGAFKTFGFSRLGKTGGPKQTDVAHRMYDYTIVSSVDIVKYYAEGFGIDDKCVLPLGVPRTDIFMSEEYASNVKNDFYNRYPQLKDKKIILFAPTFRGKGQVSAYYPKAAFNPVNFIESFGNDCVLLIKHHPFSRLKYNIDEKFNDRIIDLSDADEINDLLFVTDVLITDYSSVVFEASLLNIPMLFYAYDLYDYISERDFYCDYESFVPGKIVFSEDELIKAVNSGDFEHNKVIPFRDKYFTYTDGKSSQRVADKIVSCISI